MDFCLTQVMSGHRAFSGCLFYMGLVESPKCTICDGRGGDDAWHTEIPNCQSHTSVTIGNFKNSNAGIYIWIHNPE